MSSSMLSSLASGSSVRVGDGGARPFSPSAFGRSPSARLAPLIFSERRNALASTDLVFGLGFNSTKPTRHGLGFRFGCIKGVGFEKAFTGIRLDVPTLLSFRGDAAPYGNNSGKLKSTEARRQRLCSVRATASAGSLAASDPAPKPAPKKFLGVDAITLKKQKGAVQRLSPF
ncbi:hypothetical protein GOP47_0016933 [Adiantum capillus-veneris]|uniref:Uncharacterized protein n=1 Tax=Adiantum capillus-veneris TaxID=13818 RepID=A0A9D4ZAS7_ADICA|nr:hypothetical protein GOP47_0016933 [Adiantum capillus-veneris]